jgi:hypothetical protein
VPGSEKNLSRLFGALVLQQLVEVSGGAVELVQDLDKSSALAGHLIQVLKDGMSGGLPLRRGHGHREPPHSQGFPLNFPTEPKQRLNLGEDVEQLDIQDF